MKNFHHLCSKGNNVLFRDNQDFIYFVNKFAIAVTSYKINVLAMTTMSTHFHTIIFDADNTQLDQLILKLKRVYAIYYKNKYGFGLKNMIEMTYREFSGNMSLETEMLYVLRNPMHHYVMSSPFNYTFSSAYSLYQEELTDKNVLENYLSQYRTPKQLSNREFKSIFGVEHAAEYLKIDTKGMITFDSFINRKLARSVWSNFKFFMNGIISNVKDVSSQVIDQDVLDMKSDTMSDFEVCKIIDDKAAALGLKSFHFFSHEQLEIVISILNRHHIPKSQIARCLWL